MKKFLIGIMIASLIVIPTALAVHFEMGITPLGVDQGTLVRILYRMQTTVNELAADHDADNATVAELVTDHDADNDILNGYETLLEELAADHDADNDTLSEIVTDHDADNDILNAYETLLEELGTDTDANSTALGAWETLIEELAADHDSNNDIHGAVETLIEELAADHDADNNVIDDLKTVANAYVARYNESVVQDGNLAISATAEAYKTTQTIYAVLKGFSITKTAADPVTFTAADTINVTPAVGDYWGAWKVEMGLDGTLYTHSVSADQSYADEAAAIAALPATTANRVYVGYITVEANTNAAWTANTDDMTPASDCQDANFYDATEVGQQTAVSSSPAADLTATTTVDTVAADLAATHPVDSVAGALTASYVLGTVAADLASSTIAADLAAGTTVSTVAADLTATTVSADLAADSVLGSGTYDDPSVSLTD